MRTDIHHFWELLWGMTEKELRARYKNTMFGFLWLVINPLIQMIVIGFIFTLFIRDPVENYYFHLFTGLITWNFFSLSFTKTTPSILNERTLIKKAAFPRAVIPVSIILSNLINYFVALVIFIIPVSLLGKLTAMSPLYFIVGFVMLTCFTIGISLLTTALNVRYRDVNFFVQAILIVWFYATPIVYSLSQIPRELLWLWRLNPLTSIVQLMQHALIGSALPEIIMLTSNILIIVIITVLGIMIFREESKNFDDWL
mgnify:CR=1 FL=1